MRCVVITDSEPDDVAAIMYLLSSGVTIEYIFVIHQDTTWGCLDVIQQTLVACDKKIPHESIDGDGSNLLHALNTTRVDTVICLANWSPLVTLVRNNPDLTKTLTVYAYGSVNIRWALKSQSPDELITAITSGYKNFYCFETFWAFGPDRANDLSNDSCPEYGVKIRTSDSPCWILLRRLVTDWNVKKASEFEADIEKFMKKSPSDQKISVYRKIIQRIRHDPLQMVCADIGLVVAMGSNVPGQFQPASISFGDNNYTKINHVESSSFYHYTNGDAGLFGRELVFRIQ